MWATVIQNYSVTVVIDVIMLYPTESSFNGENALRSRLVDQIIKNYGVCRVIATICDVGLVVLVDFIFFDVGTGSVHYENSLAVITEDFVIYDFYLGEIANSYASFSIIANMVILFNF